MNRFFVLTSLALASALALAASGCSSTCTHVCEQEQKCEGAHPRACSYECNGSEHVADHVGCSSQFQTYQTCADAPPMEVGYCDDVSATRCSTERDAYVVCFNAYCAEHPGDADCRVLAL